MKRGVRPLDETEVRSQYPIADRLPGWFFRIGETSNSAWTAEGMDLWSRQVSRTGMDPDTALAACIVDARAIAAAIDHAGT